MKRSPSHAVMGYTTISSYSTFNTSPTTVNLLRIVGEYLTKSVEKLEKFSIFIGQQDMASINTINQNEAKLLFRGHWPRTPALHRGDGARGTFRPSRSGPDQARHLPEAPVPRPRKSMH